MTRRQHTFHWGRVSVIFLLGLTVPTAQIYAGMVRAEMIGTDQVVSGMAAERKRVSTFLHRSDVRKKLIEFGVSSSEASQRVASLSDSEVRQIAGQMDQLPVGGDGVYIGVGALVVVLILLILLRR